MICCIALNNFISFYIFLIFGRATALHYVLEKKQENYATCLVTNYRPNKKKRRILKIIDSI